MLRTIKTLLVTGAAIVAGAGRGKVPCAHWIVPRPSFSAETRTFSTPSVSMPTQAQTMSAMESSAPTSWKVTASGDIPWIFPSAIAMR